MSYIYKDYQKVGNILLKVKINEAKHLLWKFGGVPCIDKYVFDEYFATRKEIAKIRVQTNKGRIFKIDACLFNKEKKLINLGFGEQYVCPLEHWTIVEYKKGEQGELSI